MLSPPPASSETTSLLPEEQSGSYSNTMEGNANTSRGPLELDPESSTVEWPRQQQQQQQKRSPTTAYKMALVGILAFAIAVRFLGSVVENSNNVAIQESHGSLLSSEHYWSDEDFHQWEDFLVNGKRQQPSSSFEIDLGAASGSLLGSTLHQKATSQSASSAAAASQQSAESTALSASQAEGTLLYFNQSKAFSMVDPMQSDFFHYQQGWEAQITQALCAIATTAALLNSLRDTGPGFVLPIDPTYRPFPWATQKFLLDSAATSTCIRTALGGTMENEYAVYHMGLGMSMVPRLANCILYPNMYEAVPYPADDDSKKDAMKEMVLQALKDPASRVIYNYDRGGIGQGPMGHGHWSPIGGYHEATDSFLIMDVAKYKHPMVWVSWEQLWSGAATIDTCGETLSLTTHIDWSGGFSSLGSVLRDYLVSRCNPGHRGFVIVSPVVE